MIMTDGTTESFFLPLYYLKFSRSNSEETFARFLSTYRRYHSKNKKINFRKSLTKTYCLFTLVNAGSMLQKSNFREESLRIFIYKHLRSPPWFGTQEEEEQAEVLAVDPSQLGLQESYGEFSAKYRSFHQHQQLQVDAARWGIHLHAQCVGSKSDFSGNFGSGSRHNIFKEDPNKKFDNYLKFLLLGLQFCFH